MAKQKPPAGTAQMESFPEDAHVYRLYVSAGSPLSARAIVNARQFFEQHLPGAHALAVLNLAENVDTARSDQVFASPTLIRLSPLPRRRFIGDMSNVERLRHSLGLTTRPA